MRPMTIEDLRTRLDAWFQAFNDHDPETILAMCTEDVVWEDPNLPAPLVGWDAVADHLCNQFTAFPDLHFPKEEIEFYRSLDGKRAAAGWSTRRSSRSFSSWPPSGWALASRCRSSWAGGATTPSRG